MSVHDCNGRKKDDQTADQYCKTHIIVFVVGKNNAILRLFFYHFANDLSRNQPYRRVRLLQDIDRPQIVGRPSTGLGAATHRSIKTNSVRPGL